MSDKQKQAAIDTDFFVKLTKKNADGKLFLDVMREFKATPVMHTYVYNYELAGNTAARLLVEKKLIRVVDYEEYLPKDRSHYAMRFTMRINRLILKSLIIREISIHISTKARVWGKYEPR